LNGTLASNVWNTAVSGETWQTLSWDETLHANSNITFEVRASDTSFVQGASSPAWISVGGSSPVTSGLPSGQYMQWRATLTTNDNSNTPVLHDVTVAYSGSPEVTTNAATNVTASSAVLNANLAALGTTTPVNVYFQYDTTSGAYSNSTNPQQKFATGAFQANLPGLNGNTIYYFRAVADAGGGASCIDYGAELSFRTSTVPPSVTTYAAGSISANSAVLNGYLNAKGTATSDNVSFQWGTTQGGPYPNSTTPQVMDTTGGFPADISGLGPNTTYYYRAKADGGVNGAGYGTEMSLITSKVPPSVTTGDATSVTSSSATLSGALAHMGTAATVNMSFQWGTTQGGPYPNSTPLQAKTAPTSFTAGLSGLLANTIYYFRAKGDGGAHGIAYGSEMSFTTSKVPPSVTTVGAHNITAGSATLNGQVVSLGTATTVNASFQWGTDSNNLNNETPYQVLTIPVGFQADLTGLAANTAYYYRAKADGGTHGTGYGSILSFTTGKVPPSVSTGGATGVTSGLATLNGTLHSLGSAPMVEVSFQYGTTSGMYSDQTTRQPKIAPTNFDAPLSGLAPDTTYYYRARADGGIHGTSYGTEHIFTTSTVPPSVTTNNAAHITTNTAALNGTLTVRGTAPTVNVSFQYGTTQGGPYPKLTPLQPMTALEPFHAGLTGLSPHTAYYYRAKADGGINGSSYGDEMSFRTSMFPPWVTTGAVTDVLANSATLNGDLNSLGSATTANVSFQYGTTQGGPYTNTTPLWPMTATGAFHADIGSLNDDTTYYYRAKGDGDEYGISYGEEHRFTTSSVPPSVTTSAASGITANLATLNGNLTERGTATSDNVSFQYGNTHGGPYPSSTTPQATSVIGTFHFDLTGLPGDTAYYYRAKADGGVYGTGYGAEDNFTTSMVPPAVTTDNATAVAATSATLNGFLDSMGTSPTDNVSFVWGTTSDPSTPTPIQVMNSQGYFHADITCQPLTTYFFKARADGGAHGSVVDGKCTFTTGATPPSVSTGAATDVEDHAATLNGDLHSLGTATSNNVSFQWGTSPGIYSDNTTPQVKNSPCNFNASLSGLLDNTTYYYRAMASGGAHGTVYGIEHVFTTSADPPEVTTNAATHMTTDTAWLNGTLTDLGTATTVNASFVYGTTAGGPYPNTTSPRPMTEAVPFYEGITGLTPFTTYYFKAKADGGIYGTGYGAEDNFTTNHLPPVVWTGGASDIMTKAATLNGNLYLMGSATEVNVSFDYGTKSGDYTGSTSPQAMTEREAFQADLTGLIPATTYYYRAKGVGDNGSGLGAEQVFTTSSFPPAVTTDSATSIVATSATLNGNLDSRGTATTVNVAYEWGTTHRGPYPNTTALQAKTASGAFNASLSGLTSFTVYYYRAKADGGIYGISHGEEMSFITPLTPPSVTTGDATAVTSNSANLNGTLDSTGRAGTVDVSFQWGTTRGGPYPNPTPPHTLGGPASFWSNLSGLSPNTAYYFMAKADGGAFDVAYGVEKSFTTVPTPTPTPPTPPTPPNPLMGVGGQTSHGSSVTGPATTTQPIPLPNIQVQSASLSVSKVSPGTPVTVTANIANKGTVNGSIRLKLYVNGEEDSRQGVTVESGGNRTVYFTVNRSQPGTYDVYVGGVQAGSFVVADNIDPGIILFISLTLILSSFLLGLIYVWRRRQQEY
jgi:phosphodiesterase/alkaline phosphatase D-like protein